MTARFQILGSSSFGNSALLQTGSSTVLIDAGLSGRRIKTLLKAHDIDPQKLDAVFLTHEHQDHTAGIAGLSSCNGIRFFANHDTATAVRKRLRNPATWSLFETGTVFTFRDLTVRTFALPHDAYDPVGYIFEWGGNDLFTPPGSLAWFLDLGYVPPSLYAPMQRVDVLVLEANYDVEMLRKDTRRPFSVKQRIAGRHGHLSNQDVSQLLNPESSNMDPSWRHLYLAHLSRDCNDAAILERTLETFRTHNRRCGITIVDPINGAAPPYHFSW